jgi:hypothetical protein
MLLASTFQTYNFLPVVGVSADQSTKANFSFCF